MPELTKATLVKLKADPPTEEDGAKIPLQFNPATIKLTLSNAIEGGEQRGNQRRQFSGSSSTQLSFELNFDTADEGGADGKPVSVRGKTAQVEQFVLPAREGASGNQTRHLAPPRVRFQWNELKVDGVIKSLAIDFDLFAHDGTPLRAKMQVTIEEQNPRYEIAVAAQAGPGKAMTPGSNGSGAPGRSGGGAGGTDRTGTALAGESAADFAVRMGLDAAAWRGVAAGLDGTLSLEAGASVDFSSSVTVGAGLGVALGGELGASASLEGAFGLTAEAGAGVSITGLASAELAAGFALAAAGGVKAALETVAIVRGEIAASTARQAFAAPAPASSAPAQVGPRMGAASLPAGTAALARRATSDASTVPARPAMPDQPRAPLRLGGSASASRTQAPPAPPLPRADVRATSWGYGVPLRPRSFSAAAETAGRLAVTTSPGAQAGHPVMSDDPTAAPWERLPRIDPARARADQQGAGKTERRNCGCAGRCGHSRSGRWA